MDYPSVDKRDKFHRIQSKNTNYYLYYIFSNYFFTEFPQIHLEVTVKMMNKMIQLITIHYRRNVHPFQHHENKCKFIFQLENDNL